MLRISLAMTYCFWTLKTLEMLLSCYKKFWANKMARPNKCHDPSSAPGTHIKVEGETQHHSFLLTSTHHCGRVMKCLPQAQGFGHLVPSWWCCLGEVVNLHEMETVSLGVGLKALWLGSTFCYLFLCFQNCIFWVHRQWDQPSLARRPCMAASSSMLPPPCRMNCIHLELWATINPF